MVLLCSLFGCWLVRDEKTCLFVKNLLKAHEWQNGIDLKLPTFYIDIQKCSILLYAEFLPNSNDEVIFVKISLTTRRIIPVSRWLMTMVIVSPLSRVVPLPNGWLIHGGY